MRSGSIYLMGNEFSWLAGLLEAEGSFMIGTPSQPRTPRILLNMTDYDVIQRVADLWRSSIKKFRTNILNLKPQYSVQMGGGSAVSFMRLLRSVMGQRRQSQIDLAIASYQPLVPYGHRTYHLIDDAIEEYERYWLAGYLEGEGCFELSKFKQRDRTYCYPRVELTTTDHDVIMRVQRLWFTCYGVNIKVVSRQPSYDGSKFTYRVIANGAAARIIMEDLYPLMGARRQAKIREVLAGG